MNRDLSKLKSKIYGCKDLSDLTKAEAIEELEFMEESQLYAERVSLNENFENRADLNEAFIWGKTLQGAGFWAEISTMIKPW